MTLDMSPFSRTTPNHAKIHKTDREYFNGEASIARLKEMGSGESNPLSQNMVEEIDKNLKCKTK